jgi:1-acyl-sn-glycerol-3-phosphate acyltransferase
VRDWVAYRAARVIFRAIAAPMFRFSVQGAELVPPAGPAILVAAHQSWLDPPCLAAAARRPVRFLMLDTVYRQRGTTWFYRSMHGIPVRQGGFASLPALRSALRALEAGELLGIFPEGGIVRRGESGVVHPGAALLAIRSGAPIVPATIIGSDRAWPHGRRLPRPARVRVRFSRPIAPPLPAVPGGQGELLRRIEIALGKAPA